MSQQIYVIPDIHGQRAMLEDALARIEQDGGAGASVVFLGDYVDRGPDSRGVIDILADGQEQGRDWITLRGNHDQMFLEFLESARVDNPRFSNPDYTWLHHRLGGLETLASYGITSLTSAPGHADARVAVPGRHRDWLGQLPYHHVTPDILFVHAGVAPGVALADQARDDLIWIREPFLSYEAPHPQLIVHGHTALEYPTHFGNRIDLDGGAGWGRPLWPAVFEGRDCWLLSEEGRIPLRQPDR